MGRTIRTFREVIDIESVKWKNFRRQLRTDDRIRLDKVFEYASLHADAGTLVSRPHSLDVIFMCVLVELLKRIEDLGIVAGGQKR